MVCCDRTAGVSLDSSVLWPLNKTARDEAPRPQRRAAKIGLHVFLVSVATALAANQQCGCAPPILLQNQASESTARLRVKEQGTGLRATGGNSSEASSSRRTEPARITPSRGDLSLELTTYTSHCPRTRYFCDILHLFPSSRSSSSLKDCACSRPRKLNIDCRNLT